MSCEFQVYSTVTHLYTHRDIYIYIYSLNLKNIFIFWPHHVACGILVP